MSTRMAECSSCSPAVCTKSDAAIWCGAYMYDPEGSLSTLPTVMNCWLGLHFGRVLKFERIKGVKSRLIHWLCLSSTLVIFGLIVHFAGIPMNKQLWSTSYLLFMAGTCGAALGAKRGAHSSLRRFFLDARRRERPGLVTSRNT